MASSEIGITCTDNGIEKLRLLEEANAGPSTPNKPLDEIHITLTEDENKKLKSLKEADPGALTSKKPLIQEVTSILHSCYSEGEYRRYFKPISVAIGPLNHQKKNKREWRFERGEKWKLRLAAMFINFSRGTEQDFYKNIKKKIYSLRKCYNFREEQKWTDEKLAWMFLVDGCALLLFIILDVSDEWEDFRVTNGLAGIEKVDFFLLENQLPYQLLEILIDSSSDFSGVDKKFYKKSITKFINRSFLSLTTQQQEEKQQQQQEEQQKQEEEQQQQEEQEEEEEEDPVHLLDLLRRRLMGVKSKKKGEKQERIIEDGLFNTLLKGDKIKSKHWLSIRNVKELKDKGILFKAREKVDTITEIDFNDRCCGPTLTLAPICLHNTTMPLLLNLMAYELCPDFQEDCKITSYLSLLDSLIDKGEDVKELRDAGVLHHGLGSDEAVAELFNKISGILVPNLVINPELKSRIHAYCNSSKSHFSGLKASIEAKLTHTYFRSPWSFLVFLGALAGLIMTGMQTYYSFHENKLRY